MDIGMLAAEEEEEEEEQQEGEKPERKFLWVWEPKKYQAMPNEVENKIHDVYQNLELPETKEDIKR
eukprot:4113924-Karenia_brevis.AAC.1